jgi:tetratricopeptide (TPR) repeat protein
MASTSLKTERHYPPGVPAVLALLFLFQLPLFSFQLWAEKLPDCAADPACNRHYANAQTLYQQKRYDVALREFEVAYQAQPVAKLLVYIGRCHFYLKHIETSLGYYQRFSSSQATLEPSDDATLKQFVAESQAAILEQEGKRLYDRQKFADALPKLQEAYRIGARSFLVISIGRCLYHLNRWEESLDYYKRFPADGTLSAAEQRLLKLFIQETEAALLHRAPQDRDSNQIGTPASEPLVASVAVKVTLQPGQLPALPMPANVKAQATYQEALRSYKAGRYGDALIRFQDSYKALAAPELLVMIGRCQFYQGQLKESIDSYEQSARAEGSGLAIDKPPLSRLLADSKAAAELVSPSARPLPSGRDRSGTTQVE